MEIRNFTQFASLLQSTQTMNNHPSFARLVQCMMVYNSMCACGGGTDQEKANKQAECNRVYREALGAVDGIKARLFQDTRDNTISFFIDNAHHVKTLGR